ncbi:MAG: hypothetical protein M3015_12685 [Bacteroidota bacterium]|nr:hypothetical protein [Bacteroidota bacterium]
MAKKRLISSILLCAFAVIFAHSIIPHHHHEVATVLHHDGSHDGDHDDIDNNFLAHAFSHFQHGSATTIIYENTSSVFQASKFCIDKEALLFTQYVIGQLYKPPIIHGKHYSFAFTPSNYSASCLFRGPPLA